jgi:hypothetical protein
MTWNEMKASFVGRTNYITREIEGHQVQFHPISVGALFELRRIAKPLVGAISTLFPTTPPELERTLVKRTMHDNSGTANEEIYEGVSPDLESTRVRARQEAMQNAVETLLDPGNAKTVGRLVMDSCRELFPRGDKSNPKPDEFMRDLDTDIAIGFLRGVAEANVSVLGPFGDLLKARLQRAVSETPTDQATDG